MQKITKRETESFDDLIRRFKHEVLRSGHLQQLKKKEFYLKPSDRRKEKERAARAKIRKASRQQREYNI
jgi:small subunit ribosomal protein S21